MDRLLRNGFVYGAALCPLSYIIVRPHNCGGLCAPFIQQYSVCAGSVGVFEAAKLNLLQAGFAGVDFKYRACTTHRVCPALKGTSVSSPNNICMSADAARLATYWDASRGITVWVE